MIAAQLPPLKAKPSPSQHSPPALSRFLTLSPDLLLAPRGAPAPSSREVFPPRIARPAHAPISAVEALTRLGRRLPRRPLRDLGRRPGAGPVVLLELGARVVAVGQGSARSAHRGVSAHDPQESAFGSTRARSPSRLAFCDVACYPDRLLALLRRWIASGSCGTIVATINSRPTEFRPSANSPPFRRAADALWQTSMSCVDLVGQSLLSDAR